MRHRGFEVYIQCEGTTLEEYSAKVEDDGKTISCWIPSEAGKNFSICFRDVSRTEHSTQVKLYADGVRTSNGKCCEPGMKAKWPYVRLSGNLNAPYMFSKVILSDNDELLQKPAHEDFGTIEANLFRITGILQRDHKTSASRTKRSRKAMQGKRVLHEKSKKLSTHCVSMGEVVPKRSCTSLSPSGHIDPPGVYYVKFIFRYKPRELLQAQDIIPRPGLHRDQRTLKRRRSDLETKGGKSADKRPRVAPPARANEPSMSSQTHRSSTSTSTSTSTLVSEQILFAQRLSRMKVRTRGAKEVMSGGRFESIRAKPEPEVIDLSEEVPRAKRQVKREPEVIDLSED